MKIDQTRLEQALVILISNAKDSIDSKKYPTDQNGRIRFSSIVNTSSIILRIEDNGSGIHEDVVSNVFDPFVTTKDDHHGVGLTRVDTLMDMYGLEWFLESEEGKGTRVMLEVGDVV